MTKMRYSTVLKIVAIVGQQVFSVVLVLSIMILVVLFQKDILDFGDLKNKSFESSSYFASRFEDTTNEILEFIGLRRKFETDGSYDSEKLVDIWCYYNNQEITGQIVGKKGKKGNTIKYSLGDLAEWSRNYSSSDFEFISEYYLDHGIHQKQDIYKNGDSILSEEKSISNLGEMTVELQQNIIKDVEHYYGGSYSVSEKNKSTYFSFTQIENVDGGIEDTTTDKVATSEDSKELESVISSSEDSGELESSFSSEEHYKKLESIVEKVIAGKLYELDGEELELLLQDMGTLYNQSVVNYEFIDEDYLPIEGTSIWDRFMKGNCSMEQMQDDYMALEYTLSNIGREVNQYKRCLNLYNLTQDGTNVYYWICRGNEDSIYTNISEPISRRLTDYGEKIGKYVFYQENDIRLETNVKGMEDAFYSKLEPKYGGKGNILFICIDTNFPNKDNFFRAKMEYVQMYPWIRISIICVAISFLLCLICLIYLSIAAGRREGEEKIYLNLFDKLPTEILFIISIIGGIAYFVLFGELLYHFDSEELMGLLIMSGVLTFFSTAFLLIFYLSFVRRIRAGVLWKQSVLGWFVHGISLLFTRRKSSTKMLFLFGLHLLVCFFLLQMICVYRFNDAMVILGIAFFILLSGIEAVLMIREGVQRNKVLQGIHKISDGDLEYKIEEGELRGENRQLAAAVNMIGEGLYHAVEDSVKNEHLKTDLITNVSHDIKTPLTSIINYVDLLKREDLKNERVQNYISVLDSKSQRLKQLTEDLVEASKVSSGNISLQMERINLVELVYQTGGEFDEKFEARGLTLIAKLPREPVVIMADGRRIWRVLENLYNNVAKYAMKNTRVYVDMEADGEQVCFSIKNISENPLNIQADELTERFIRGDISRSTEGSGLGLSIAKSLTILMGGIFEIYLDGDLFKATISFKQEESIIENS